MTLYEASLLLDEWTRTAAALDRKYPGSEGIEEYWFEVCTPDGRTISEAARQYGRKARWAAGKTPDDYRAEFRYFYPDDLCETLFSTDRLRVAQEYLRTEGVRLMEDAMVRCWPYDGGESGF